jgi:hypothetical protein
LQNAQQNQQENSIPKVHFVMCKLSLGCTKVIVSQQQHQVQINQQSAGVPGVTWGKKAKMAAKTHCCCCCWLTHNDAQPKQQRRAPAIATCDSAVAFFSPNPATKLYSRTHPKVTQCDKHIKQLSTHLLLPASFGPKPATNCTAAQTGPANLQ